MSLTEFQQVFDEVFKSMNVPDNTGMDQFFDDVRNLGYQACLTLNDDQFLQQYNFGWGNNQGAINLLNNLRSAITKNWHHWIISYSSTSHYNQLMNQGYFQRWRKRDLKTLTQYMGTNALWEMLYEEGMKDVVLDNSTESNAMSYLDILFHQIYADTLGDTNLEYYIDNSDHKDDGITDIGIITQLNPYHVFNLLLDIEAKKQFYITGLLVSIKS
eukprot:TRINITY_DN1884_c0_g1_i2.p1 TRINITY_DN1884_c0_g1~~TRINITY_DN1884_c0_g1_i2.p1  ORF type:complete len:215 (-),score=39.12 TRINITY_DN1884_c0_g1_i2:1251-1895(-)